MVYPPMSPRRTPVSRLPATHAKRVIVPDADFELGLAAYLRTTMTAKAIVELWGRSSRARASSTRSCGARSCARSPSVSGTASDEAGAGFLHAENFEIGDGVSIGAQASVQGRGGGTCRLGARVWIGPQAYLDARSLEIEDEVGIGPGMRILGSAHTGLPSRGAGDPTDLEVEPVRIERGADVGVNAVVLPGVTIGPGSIVGAGAVVTRDVPPLAVVAGVPAAILRYRRDPRPRKTEDG